MRFFVAILCVAAPAASFAQILNAAPTANNGSGGVFMDLTPTSQNLTINSFETFFSSAGAYTAQIWTRPGTYVGFTGSNAGWTLFDTIAGTSTGSATLSPVVLNNVLSLTAGNTTGLYLIGTVNNIRYNGTAALPPTTTWSNADLTMFSAHTRTGGVAFGGSLFTPRTFAGNVRYTVEAVPEPATMAVLGMGALALLRRRKKA
jgi:hypothetical protein